MAWSSTVGNVALYFPYFAAAAVACAGVSSGKRFCAYCVIFFTGGSASTKTPPSNVFVTERRTCCATRPQQ